MHLLIDNSNTRTKFALWENGTLLDWRAVIPTSEISSESLAKTLAEVDFERATLCSVVPVKAKIIRDFLDVPFHQITHLSASPITIEYPEPSQIGADRLANSAAAWVAHRQAAVVIDFGTAVTFDVLSKDGAYLGGVIAPGTAALRDYLHRSTALLPEIQLAEPDSAIGKSTSDAMQIGAVVGYRGLIREILQEVTRELGGNPKLLATGGDAQLITAGLAEKITVDPELTLKGIALIGEAGDLSW